MHFIDSCKEFLEDLIRIPSVNGVNPEKALLDRVEAEANKLGLSCLPISSVPERPNLLIGEVSQSRSAPLWFISHADTVPVGEKPWRYPPFSASVEGNKLYGRGAIDCKGGLALSLYALKHLLEHGHKDLAQVLVVSDEEAGADSPIGLMHVLKEGYLPRAAVYTYGGSKEGQDICSIGHRGLLRIWVKFQGKSAHSGSLAWQKRSDGASAIEPLVQFLNQFTFSKTEKFDPELLHP